MRFAFNVLILVLVFPFSLPAIVDSQTTAQPATGVSIDLSQMNFYQLRQKRDLLDAQIQKDQAQRSTLDTTVYWLKQEANGKRDLADEQKKSQPDKKRIDELTKAINTYRDNSASNLTLEQAQGALKQKDSEIDMEQNSKDQIERKMSDLIDIEKPKQSFKTSISLIFAGLVAGVIAGFFIVAFRDEKVRREIFSGQSGIQFITLFSLVIAIILFGITEILEGKELSALLGGLSGYILGRSATRASSTTPNQET